MPKFPTYERQQGLRGGSTASYASDGAFTAPARALANMGGAVADLGADIRAGEAKFRETQRDAHLSKVTSQAQIDLEQQERDAQQNATGYATDYAKGADSRFQDYTAKTLATITDPVAKQKYQAWADDYRAKYVNRAATFQAGSEVAQRTSDLSTSLSNFENLVYSDPSQYDSAKTQAFAALDAAKKWLPPEAEVNLRAKAEHDLNLARAKGKADADPNGFIQETGRTVRVPAARMAPDVQTRGAQAMGFFQSKGYTKEQAAGIVGNLIAESNLQPSGAVGDNGTAFGIAQWRGERLTRLKRFANANGKDWQDFGTQLAFVDMELQNHETGAYQALKNAKTVDEATAAFVGYERPAGWSPGNPRGGHNYKGRLSHAAAMAGGEAVAFHEGGDFSADPRYAGLSVDEIRSLSNQAETTINAQQVTAYASMKDAINLGITTGEILSEDQILGSALNDGDKATMLNKFRTERKDEIAAMETIASLNARTFEGDPYDTDTRKNIDNVAEELKKRATPEQYQLAAEEIVRQSGIVPKDVVNAIRKGLESTNAAEVAAAAQQAARLSAVDPAALGRRDGGKEAQNAADDFSHMVNNLNMTPEEAAKRIIDMNDPEKKRERKAIEPAAKEFIKEMEDFSLAGEFNDTWFGGDPAIGFSPGQELGIKAEFLAIAEEQFYAANGDPEIAQNRAVEQMKRLYGVTQLTGRKVVIKHPPENYWPKSSMGTTSQINPNAPGTPSLSYAQQQLEAEIRVVDPNVDMAKVDVFSTPATDREVKANEMPGYVIMWTDENGLRQTLTPGMQWRPDPKRAGEFNAQQEEERIEGAKAQERQSRQQAPYRNVTPEDFMSGNDPVFGAR